MLSQFLSVPRCSLRDLTGFKMTGDLAGLVMSFEALFLLWGVLLGCVFCWLFFSGGVVLVLLEHKSPPPNRPLPQKYRVSPRTRRGAPLPLPAGFVVQISFKPADAYFGDFH